MVSAVPTVGVLALQGSFAEHFDVLSRLPYDIRTIVVRTAQQLDECDALVIPGGESSTISLLARTNGLFDKLVDFAQQAKRGRKALWGTCAGMILCAKEVVNARDDYRGLQAVDIGVVRNQWGRQVRLVSLLRIDGLDADAESQIASFTDALTIEPLCRGSKEDRRFHATFIRAPVTHTILPLTDAQDPPVEVLARVPRSILPSVPPDGTELGPDADVVMLKQGNILLSSFHPELGKDNRVHDWFVREMVLAIKPE